MPINVLFIWATFNVVTFNVVNVPASGVTLPINVLFIELVTPFPVIASIPVTVNATSVPTDVKLLFTVVLGKLAPPTKLTPFTLKSPVILILP